MPQFRGWSKNALGKLTYYLVKEPSYIRHQVVYREGDVCEKVYIVASGEFEVNRRRVRVREGVSTEKLSGYLGEGEKPRRGVKVPKRE